MRTDDAYPTERDTARPVTRPIRRLAVGLFVVAVVGSLFDYSPVSDTVHVAVTVPAVALCGVLAVYARPSLELPRLPLLAFVITWVVYFLHAVLAVPETWALVRYPPFVAGSFVLLFVVPNVITRRQFFRTLLCLAAGLTILGLPAYLVGPYRIGPVAFSTAAGSTVGGGVAFAPLTSMLTNPNPFGIVTGLGTLAGVGVWTRSRRTVDALLLAVAAVGLCLSASRSSLLGVTVGGALIGASRIGGRRAVVATLCAGGSVAAYLVATLAGVVPDVLGVREITFYNRFEFWTTAVRTLDGAELLGLGLDYARGTPIIPNLHSGYVTMLVSAGVVGFAAHVALLGFAYRRCLSALDDETATLLALLSMVLLVMLFESLILFGYAALPVLVTLVVGYAVQPSPLDARSPR